MIGSHGHWLLGKAQTNSLAGVVHTSMRMDGVDVCDGPDWQGLSEATKQRRVRYEMRKEEKEKDKDKTDCMVNLGRVSTRR